MASYYTISSHNFYIVVLIAEQCNNPYKRVTEKVVEMGLFLMNLKRLFLIVSIIGK